MLTKKDYVNGSFKRKLLVGNFLYERFEMDKLYIDKSKGNKVIKDTLAERILTNSAIYKEKIDELFYDFNDLKEYTNEEVYGLVNQVRRSIFPKSYYDNLIEETKNRIKKIINIKYSSTKEFIQKLIYINEKNPSYTTNIDRSNLLIELLETKTNDLCFLCSDPMELTVFLNYAKSNLKDKYITLFLKSKSTQNEPTVEHFNYILSLDPGLKKLNLEVVEYQNIGLGLNLLELNEDAISVFEGIKNGEKDLMVVGESQIFSLVDSYIPYYLISKIVRITSQTYTNDFLPSNGKIPYVVTFVDSGYKTGIDFHGTEIVKLNLQQYDKLYFTLKDRENYKENILLGNINQGLNPYSVTYEHKKFENLVTPSNSNNIIEKREEWVQRLAKQEFSNQGFNYINSYYSYDNFNKSKYKIFPETEQNGVLLRGVSIEDKKSLNINVKLAENYSAGIISIRELLERKEVSEDFQLYNNFLYFFTLNLQRLYNNLRENRPYEKLLFKNFYLGYKYTLDNEEKKELFPLYNKGYMGFKPNGDVIFGRKTLFGGKIQIGKTILGWEKDQVNNFSKKFTIITPMYVKNIIGDKKTFRKYRKIVGENRFNIVVVNNKIICSRMGDVVIPSIGVILSFEKKYGLEIIKELKLNELENGYYGGNFKFFLLDLEKTKEEEDTKWILGGGTLLIKDGVPLMEDEKNSFDNFFIEGWHNPLSMQTQETQVQDWVRGPRSLIGVTKENKMFIVTFSGRSLATSGARFDEIIKILTIEFGEIKELLNLDGGASVCFGMILKGEFFELNLTAPSELNIKGMVRPVNSMLLLKNKT